MRFLKLFIKNKKPNKRRTLIAGNMLKRGWVNGPRGESSWSRRAIVDTIIPDFANSFVALFITLDGRYDGSSQALIITMNQQDGTVMATMVRHALCNLTLGQNSPYSFSSFTKMPPKGCHRHDGPSQAPQVVTYMYFLVKNIRVHPQIDFLQIKINLHKNNRKRLLDTH